MEYTRYVQKNYQLWRKCIYILHCFKFCNLIHHTPSSIKKTVYYTSHRRITFRRFTVDFIYETFSYVPFHLFRELIFLNKLQCICLEINFFTFKLRNFFNEGWVFVKMLVSRNPPSLAHRRDWLCLTDFYIQPIHLRCHFILKPSCEDVSFYS